MTLTGGTGTDTLNLYPNGVAGSANLYDNTSELADSTTGFEVINILDNPLGNSATSIDLGAYDPGTGKNITIDSSALDTLDAALTIDASSVTAATTGKQITFTGGNNATKFTAGNDDDTITTGSAADTIVGTAGSNVIDAGAGNDIIDGGTGNENTGGAGNDTIDMAGNYVLIQ